MTSDQLKEIVPFVAAVCGILAFFFPIILAGYRYLKSKRLYFSMQMFLVMVLHGTILYLVHIYTDMPGILVAVSVMLVVLVYLVGDGYKNMFKETQEVAEDAIDIARNAVDQRKMMAKELEEFRSFAERATDQSE